MVTNTLRYVCEQLRATKASQFVASQFTIAVWWRHVCR